MRRLASLRHHDSEDVQSSFDGLRGLTCGEICDRLGVDVNFSSKSFVKTVVDHMISSTGGLDPGTRVKTIRVDDSLKPVESMVYQSFDYMSICKMSWEESQLYQGLCADHLFFIFKKDPDRTSTMFLGTVPYRFGEDQLESAHAVWEDTREKVLSSSFNSFMLESETDIVFVRTHGRNSADTIETMGGGRQKKRSFWLSKRFITDNVLSRLA